jgi:hypothetical protein
MTPRERRLLVLLGVAVMFTVFAAIAATIRSGLAEIEARNELRRDALRALDIFRQQKAQPDDGPQVPIPDEAPGLVTYVDAIAKEVGVEVPRYEQPPSQSRGTFNEVTVELELREVTIYQLADLLEKIETRNPAIAITSLSIERSFRDDDKLRKAAMTVTTWERAKQAPAGGEPG